MGPLLPARARWLSFPRRSSAVSALQAQGKMLVDRLLCRGLDIFTDACYNVAQAVVFRALGQVANPVQKTVRFFVIENAEFFIFAELILDPRLRSPCFPYSLTNAATFASVSVVAALPSVKPPVLGRTPVDCAATFFIFLAFFTSSRLASGAG